MKNTGSLMMLTLGLMTAIGAEVPFTAAFPPVEKVEVAAGEPESVSEPIVFPSLKGGDGVFVVSNPQNRE